jgi:hypothetical protein
MRADSPCTVVVTAGVFAATIAVRIAAIEVLTIPHDSHVASMNVATVVKPHVTAPCMAPLPDVLLPIRAATKPPANNEQNAVTKYHACDHVVIPPGLDNLNTIKSPNAANSSSVASATSVPLKIAGHDIRLSIPPPGGTVVTTSSTMSTSNLFEFLHLFGYKRDLKR